MRYETILFKVKIQIILFKVNIQDNASDYLNKVLDRKENKVWHRTR